MGKPGVADPRDRILFEILAARQAIAAPAVARTCPETEADVIAALERAYGTLNYNLYRSLLADNAPDNAEFRFFLSEPTGGGETQWAVTEELRIHQRMFVPERTPEGDVPVPPELWVQSIDIHLTQLEPFQERPDLYSQDGGADGKLDPGRWRATDARYATDVFWNTQGDVDYQVTGQAIFVVIQDRERRACASGRFLLYIWEDIGSPAAATVRAIESQVSWSEVKALYR